MSNKYVDKYYYYIYIIVSICLFFYVIFSIYFGDIKLCSGGGLCLYFSEKNDSAEFYALSIGYGVFGLFFLYLFFRERKKCKILQSKKQLTTGPDHPN